MARKQFNFIPTTTGVTVQRLSYKDVDAPAEVAEERSYNLEDLPAEFQNGEALISLAGYGLSQLLQDRASSVTTDEKLDTMDKVFGNLVDGKWKETRVSTGGGAKKPTIDSFFAKGFALFLQSQGKDVDADSATLLLQGMDADKRKALRQHEAIKAFVEKAKADAAASVADLDLDGLL